MSSKIVRIDRNLMQKIPPHMIKKYHLHEGSQVIVDEIEGSLSVVPYYEDFREAQKMLSSREKMMASLEKIREEELALENR